MGKSTGFMEWPRVLPRTTEISTRLQNYKEIVQPQSREENHRQAGRCMDCGVPVCQQGCPLGNMIPDWNDYVYKDRWQQAYQRLVATNNFPEFTGRLCPAPCEKSCVLAINQDPVTIEQIEKEIIEHAFAHGWVTAPPLAPTSGKTVAIVGSGPAGLAAAEQLAIAGHAVTVFEGSDQCGGLLRYGIPDFKLEKSILDRRLALMEEMGIAFRTNCAIGRGGENLSWSQLHKGYDALLICIGAGRPRELRCAGLDEANGVHFAMEFLTRQNRLVAGAQDCNPALDAKGKHVVILGGGDTGSDCLGTCHRQGAASVVQIELFPEPASTRPATNPWPQWPLVLRTSSSHEEGGTREYGMMTTGVVNAGGQLKELQLVRVEIDNGAPKPIAGSEFTIPADMLLLAIGFVSPVTEGLTAELGLDLSPRGTVAVDEGFRTSIDRVYAAGDASRGASLIVWAISDGREAARTVDMDLRGEDATVLPTRGRNCSFD